MGIRVGGAGCADAGVPEDVAVSAQDGGKVGVGETEEVVAKDRGGLWVGRVGMRVGFGGLSESEADREGSNGGGEVGEGGEVLEEL